MQEEQFLKDVFNIAKVEKPFSQFDPAFRAYDMVYKVTTTDGMSKTIEVPELMYENMAGTSLLEQVVAFKNLLHYCCVPFVTNICVSFCLLKFFFLIEICRH